MTKEEEPIEKLAQMIQAGFSEVGDQFEGVNDRLDQIDSRLDNQTASMGYTTERLDRIEELVASENRTRIDRLEQTVQKLKAKVGLD